MRILVAKTAILLLVFLGHERIDLNGQHDFKICSLLEAICDSLFFSVFVFIDNFQI